MRESARHGRAWAAHATSATKADDQVMFYQAAHGLNVYGICTFKLMPYATMREPDNLVEFAFRVKTELNLYRDLNKRQEDIDTRGIYVARVCDACREQRLAG
jgi:hypothetical protein